MVLQQSGGPGIADAERVAERALVEKAQRGDREAFGELVRQSMRRAYYVALGLVGSPDDALDLSQDAFVRAFAARHTLDPERPFYPWYYQILRRRCFNFLRDSKLHREKLATESPWIVADANQKVQTPEREAELKELRQRLQTAIDTLPDHEREVFVLREYDGLRYREIADLVGIPQGTVMSRLYSARRRLANELGEQR